MITSDQKQAYEYMKSHQKELLKIIVDLLSSHQTPHQIHEYASAYLNLQPTLLSQIKIAAEYLQEKPEGE